MQFYYGRFILLNFHKVKGNGIGTVQFSEVPFFHTASSRPSAGAFIAKGSPVL